MCVCVVTGADCSVRGGCGCVRAVADGHLHAPDRHLPPPLPLLRGEGGAGGPLADGFQTYKRCFTMFRLESTLRLV